MSHTEGTTTSFQTTKVHINTITRSSFRSIVRTDIKTKQQTQRKAKESSLNLSNQKYVVLYKRLGIEVTVKADTVVS